VTATFVIAGIFVGGAGLRMGGRAKGLLVTPEGETLIARCRRVLWAAGASHVLLVGAHPAYASLGLEMIPDRPAGIGPMGGLLALLERARDAPSVAVACDMPFVTEALVRRLLAAPDAPITAPRRAHRWEPLCARYKGGVLPYARSAAANGHYSLQRLLDQAGTVELPLSNEEIAALDDWDAPEDIALRWPVPHP
jgi:molybdenum cofactor guanylyltransferase